MIECLGGWEKMSRPADKRDYKEQVLMMRLIAVEAAGSTSREHDPGLGARSAGCAL